MFRKIALSSALMVLFAATALVGSTKIFAHRGASSVAPENTLAAFLKAVEFESDYFELDVQVSADDSLMIMHDETIDRTTDGTGTVNTMSYEQLRNFDAGSWFAPEFAGEKIPTLAEALDLALDSPYRVGVVIEIKANTPTIVEKVVAEVTKRQMQERVIISSFTFEHLSRVKSVDSSIPVQLFGTITESNIDQVAGIGGEWVGTDGTITQIFLDYAHAKNVLVNKWTVNSAAEMSSLLQLGVDAITTNFPQTYRALTDTTPPSDVHLSAADVNVTKVILTWTAAEDAESGVVGYEIYRDTSPNATFLICSVGNVTTYVDETRKEATTFYYRIKAVNLAGLTSLNFSNEIMITTGSDVQAPKVTFISSFGEANRVIVGFNERVEKNSAEETSHYQIDNQVTVTQARLSLDSTSVILRTSDMTDNTQYIISIIGVADMAAIPNILAQPLDIPFFHHPFLPQTAAAWDLDEGEGSTIHDASGNANDGNMNNDVGWSAGYTGNGLLLDGIDDYIRIPSSSSLNISGNAVTVSLWTKLFYMPNELPGNYGPIYDSDTDNYVIYQDKNTNELRFKVTTTAGAERPGIPASQLSINEWLHIVGVYDGSHAMIYLNGQLQDSHTLTGNVKPGQIALIGQSAGSFFKGSIDNIQIFSRALVDDEIQFLYSGQKENVAVADRAAQPQSFWLAQNYPNPCNPSTTIRYAIPRAGLVRLKVYDLLGREVITALHQYQQEGAYSLQLNTAQLAAGMYVYRLFLDSYSSTKKMLVIK
ncbi:T9SS type A sorting domain-containing protein [candidate division KSB1 bacterium]|nr:T9SS type A sorting domain-containing protein [candidate division KSB1 bacterium]